MGPVGWTICTLIVLVTTYYSWRFFRTDVTNLPYITKRLLYQGYHGGRFFYHHRLTGRFVQFHKYIDNNIYGICLSHPDFGRMKRYSDQVKSTLDEHGIEWFAVTHDDGCSFIYGDFKHDWQLAADIARIILQDVCGIPKWAGYKYWNCGMSANLEEIIVSCKDQPKDWRTPPMFVPPHAQTQDVD